MRSLRKPTFKHVVPTRDHNLTYTILAYRMLTRSEIVATVRSYGDTKFDSLRDGNIEIISMIGYTESVPRQRASQEKTYLDAQLDAIGLMPTSTSRK